MTTMHALNEPLADLVQRAGALQADLDDMGAGRPKVRRGTSNKNVSGNAEDRRRRRMWLLDTFRANVDVLPYDKDGDTGWDPVPIGVGIKACRCFRCGDLLTLETLTVDRIIPGAHGGTYRRNNIRPACGDCNSETGGRTRAKSKAAR